MASGLGPMKVTPMRAHSSAKPGSSATKPQPTQAASAPVSRQRPLEDGVVEVGPVRGRAEVVGEVGLAHEHRALLALGVQRDRLDAVPVGARLRVEVAHRVDEPHGGLAAVDDGDAREHPVGLPATADKRYGPSLRPRP